LRSKPGVYPDVSLRVARDKREDARKKLADGIDPGEHRKAVKTAGADRRANSFEVVAREWFAKFSAGWVKNHANKIIRRLERQFLPPQSQGSPNRRLDHLLPVGRQRGESLAPVGFSLWVAHS
jgi:hypothetical protein